jgi:hypothetical protein
LNDSFRVRARQICCFAPNDRLRRFSVTQRLHLERLFLPLSRRSLRLAAGGRGRLNGHNPTEAAIP